MRAGVPVLFLVLSIAVAAGCASSASRPGDPAADPADAAAETQGADGVEPAASGVAPAASEPVPAPPAGGGTLPAITDGLWMGGTIHAEFGGSHPLTVDAPLIGGPSITSGGFTSLFYKVGEDPDSTTVQLVLDPEQGGPAISLTSPTVLVAGGVTEGCTTTIDKNDGSAISGTLTCPALPGMVVGANSEVQDSVTATWSAER